MQYVYVIVCVIRWKLIRNKQASVSSHDSEWQYAVPVYRLIPCQTEVQYNATDV